MRRLRKNRAMSSVTLRMPEDVVEDLKRVAPTLGFAGYQPLIRAYIGKGLRIDLARLGEGSVPRLIASGAIGALLATWYWWSGISL